MAEGRRGEKEKENYADELTLQQLLGDYPFLGVINTPISKDRRQREIVTRTGHEFLSAVVSPFKAATIINLHRLRLPPQSLREPLDSRAVENGHLNFAR